MQSEITKNRMLKLLREIELANKDLEAFFEFNDKKMSSNNRLESLSAAVAVSGFVQSLYTKAEDIFKFVAKNIDNEIPSGDGWHKEILEQMAVNSESRSPLITEATLRELNNIRLFRHVVRNNYAGDLNAALVASNAKLCMSAVKMLCNDLKDFLTDEETPSVHEDLAQRDDTCPSCQSIPCICPKG